MHENKKSNFHINGFALSLALKQRLGQFINGLLIEKITKRSNNTEKTSAKAECNIKGFKSQDTLTTLAYIRINVVTSKLVI